MSDELGSRWSEPAQAHLGVQQSRPHYLLLSPDQTTKSDLTPTDWRLKLDHGNVGVAAGWPERSLPPDAVPAEVPGVWNTAYPGYSGVGWYECAFRQPFLPHGMIRLVVGAANYLTDAWLNGVYLGRHEGGYDAFSFGCGHAMQDGQNRLTLRIVDPSPDGEIDGFRLRECPTAKESWYGGAGGPWGGVWLEQSPRVWIEDVRVHTDPPTGRVTLRISLASDLPADREIDARVGVQRSETVVAEQSVRQLVSPNGAVFAVTLTAPEPQLWSPEFPRTYLWSVSLTLGGKSHARHDSAAGWFGFRTVELRDGVFHLNGEPRYLKGALLQPTYPRTLIRQPDQMFRRDIETARSAGLNLIRSHLRPPDDISRFQADRQGMMLYVEPPLAWIEPSGRLLEHGKRELAAMVRACGNHPSVVMWGIFNENAAATEAVGGELMAELAALDPTRPIIENSGGAAIGEVGMWAWGGQSRCWSPGWDAPRPFNDLHVYLSNPLRAEARQLLTTLGDGPTVNVTPGRPESERVESRITADPVLVSEYGCGALPDFEAALAAFGEETHLADAVLLRELRDNLTRGLAERGLDREIGDVQALVRQTQALQAEGILAQTAALRRNPNVSGLIVTQLADAGWEQMAGLTGLWRHPRPALEALKRALQPRLLHVEPADPCCTGTVTLHSWMIQDPGLPPLTATAVLSVSIDGQPADAMRSRPVRIPASGKLPATTITLPPEPGRYQLRATLQADGWRDEAACIVTRLPDRPIERGDELVLLGRGLRRALPAALMSVPADWRGPILSDLVSTLSIDATMDAIRSAQAGAHVVLAGMNPYWAEWFEGILPLPIAVHGARGNFMGMHHYRRRHPVFDGLGAVDGPGLADGSWAETLPTWVLDELPGATVSAGCFTVPDGGRNFLWRASVQTISFGQGRLTFWQLPLGERRGGVLGGQLLSALVRWLLDGQQ